MAGRATGQVVIRERESGRVFALRFRAYGTRRYVTLGSASEGWTRAKAQVELENVLADVRRGIWQPPRPEPTAAEPVVEPTFHEFASEWLHSRAPELSARTVEDYTWALSCHLLPFFAGHRLSAITIQEVDRYRTAKVRERERHLVDRPLSNTSINKTLTRLAQILDVAVEYGHIDSNPARGRRRRLKPSAPRRAWLEPDQVWYVLEAAGPHRALLATLTLAGLRVSELTSLLWADVDLAGGRLEVRGTKTVAAARTIDLSPNLREELALHRAATPFADPADLVFPTSTGARRDRGSVLKRIVRPSIIRANVALEEAGQSLISSAVTTHSLRHTFASLLFEAGATVPYVMSQLGHSDPAVTLRIYAHVLKSKGATGARLDALVSAANDSWSAAAIETEPNPRTAAS